MSIPRQSRVAAVTTMVGLTTLAALALIPAPDAPVPAHAQSRIDFGRDIQPLLKERCYECHGPTKQMNGYRLDQRSRALAGVVRPNIIPGSSDSSRLVRRVISPEFGTQMPPEDELSADEIAILKRWIDEGAHWPDALANERPLPPENPRATRVGELIRSSRYAAALQEVRRTPAVVNEPGSGGSTPLMYAALYGTSAVVAELLKAGADPNARNHVGATALMWAIDDGDKVKLLLDAGADVNAASDFGRQPLMLAAAQVGTMPTVKLLLERGAEPTTAALSAAAARGNVDLVRVLLAAGARDSDNRVAATNALRGNSRDALEAITATQKPAPMRGGLFAILPPGGSGRPDALAAALERGADVNAKDAKSRTPLMLAAMAEAHAPELIRLLLARGADPAVKDPAGRTALDFARRLGSTPALDALAAAGAPGDTLPNPTLAFVTGNTPRAAVARSLPLLQRTAVQFYEKSGCVSCHHNSLTQMTVATARRNGFAIAEALARKELTTVVEDIRVTREQALQGIVSPGGLTTTSGYILMGLAADRHPADAATDALVRLIVTRQLPDGRWASAYRPPSESSEFTAAAVGLRGIQLYGTATPPQRRAVAAAAAWLASAPPQSTEDRVFKLLGLTWADAPQGARQSAIQDLLASQRTDGGWAQLPAMSSDAYATGSALVALHESGVRPDDPVYRRGIKYILETQLADGSWFVPSRSHQTQIYFESGFPHGANQFISAAATNWATQALILSEQKRTSTTPAVIASRTPK